MNCIIVEDEKNAAEHLEYLLSQCRQQVNILAKIGTVKAAFQWLKHNSTDLIFLDVQLGDDLGFSIFENMQVSTPVIFTTSYEEYAIRAFQVNSVSYLLKPIELDELQSALDKYENLFLPAADYNSLSRIQQQYQKRFLVQSGSEILSLKAEEIAYFYVQNRHLFITTISGEQYLFDSTLEAVEARIDPEIFFRINRQYIVAIHAIEKMYSYSRGRIKLITNPATKEELIVSIDRATEFKNWLNK